MTFWSGARLLADGATKAIVDPFDANMIDCSAYTLTLGEEAYVTPHYGANPRDSIKQTLAQPRQTVIGGVSQNVGGGVISVPPGQFGFLLTEEIVSIPRDAMGFISLKSKPKFGGLINVSGFHVDPGFNGRLIFSVFNAGPNPLHFSRGDRLFLLWLADLSGIAQVPYFKSGAGYAEIPSDLITKVTAENHSLQSLSRRVESLTSQVAILSGAGAAIGIVAGLLLAWYGIVEKPDRAAKQTVEAVGPAPNVTPSVRPSQNELKPVVKPTAMPSQLAPTGS